MATRKAEESLFYADKDVSQLPIIIVTTVADQCEDIFTFSRQTTLPIRSRHQARSSSPSKSLSTSKRQRPPLITPEPSPKRTNRDQELSRSLLRSHSFKTIDRRFWPAFWLRQYAGGTSQQPVSDDQDRLQNVWRDYNQNQAVENVSGKTTNMTILSSYLSHGNTSHGPSTTHQALSKLFDKYRDQPETSSNKILIDGLQNYMNDLGVAPDEVASLALFDITSCKVFGEIEREAFITGWTAQPSSPDSKDKQKSRIDALRKEIPKNRQLFTKVYRFSFNVLRPEGQRNIPVESSIDVWKMFFTTGRKGREGGIQWKTASTDWLAWWLEFYGTKINRPVNKDLWNMVAELAFKTMEPGGDTLEWWSEDAAWPGAVDEFIQWARERKGLPPPGTDEAEQGDSMDVT